jgi:predicted  nucleic acid-binding Zn-ribbon protein
MKEDFSELIEYLDVKFTRIDERFARADKRFDGIEENMRGLKGEMSEIKEKLNDKADKIDVDNLLTAIDGYAGKADTYFQEMVMLSHKVDRHEKWLIQLAEKLGVKLEY